MDASITTRDAWRQDIARDAEMAAAFFVAGGKKPHNPYAEDEPGHQEWQATFSRYVDAHTVEADGGA
jgi:hypothetical protein